MTPWREVVRAPRHVTQCFSSRETPFLAWSDPKTPLASVARAGGGAPGWEGAGTLVWPVQPRERRGLRPASPSTGTAGKRRQPGSSQRPAQNRGVCWASKTLTNTPAPR